MNSLQSELLKYKRTFMGKLIVFIPMFFALYALVIQATIMKNPLSGSSSWMWQSLLALVFNWWPFVFLPLGYGLFASLAAAQEKKSGNYRALRTRNVSPIAIWINKIIAMAVISFLSTLVLVTATMIVGLLSKSGAIPFGQIIGAGAVCWFTSLALIPIQLWAATWNGMFLSMGIAFAGMIAGIIAAPQPFWMGVPWSWATRMMCPIIGIHPNGILLEAGDPLMNATVIPAGIAISFIVFSAAAVLTAVWFSKREV